MHVFSFRAECPYDTNTFVETLTAKHIPFEITIKELPLDTKPEPRWLGDMQVELKTDMTLREVRLALHEQDDAHVMIESLREVPLAQNPLGRDADVKWWDPNTF